jgi:hypothetical protein
MSHYLNISLVFAAAAICLGIASQTFAQDLKEPASIIVNGNNNETVKSELDRLAQTAGDCKLIIMVARLGHAEYSGRLNYRRLQTLSSYLETVRAIPKQRVIKTVGEPTPDRGRIEVYLGGELFMVFALKHNQNFAPEP